MLIFLFNSNWAVVVVDVNCNDAVDSHNGVRLYWCRYDGHGTNFVWMRQSCGDTNAASLKLGPKIRFRFGASNVQCVLTKWSTVLTTSRLDTWPTSISPMSTANFRLSVIDILTTSSGRFMSLYGGRVRSAIFHWFSSFVHTIYAQFLSNQPESGAKIINIILNHWNVDARTCTLAHTAHSQCVDIFTLILLLLSLNGSVCMTVFFRFNFIHSVEYSVASVALLIDFSLPLFFFFLLELTKARLTNTHSQIRKHGVHTMRWH